MFSDSFRTMAVVSSPVRAGGFLALMMFLQGPFLTCKHFLPSLEKAVDPKIVNITSEFGSVSGNHILCS